MEALIEMDEVVEVRSLELPMAIVDVALEAFVIGGINVIGKLCVTVFDVVDVAGEKAMDVFERLEFSETVGMATVVDIIPGTPLVEETVRLFEVLVALPPPVVDVKFEDHGVVNQTLEFSPGIEETCDEETKMVETEAFTLVELDWLLLVTSRDGDVRFPNKL